MSTTFNIEVSFDTEKIYSSSTVSLSFSGIIFKKITPQIYRLVILWGFLYNRPFDFCSALEFKHYMLFGVYHH